MAFGRDYFSRLSLRAFQARYPSAERMAARAERLEKAPARLRLDSEGGELIDHLRALGVSDVDLWHGSHVILRNERTGRFYDLFKAQGSPRISSHYPQVKAQQYEIPLGKHGVVLFGLTPEGNSWFQLERHAFEGFRRPLSALEHTDDFLEYFTTKSNIGPLGRSPHTEHKNPVQLDLSAKG